MNLVLYFNALVNLKYISNDQGDKPRIENPKGWIKLIQYVGTLSQYPLEEFTSGGSLLLAMHLNQGLALRQDLDSAWASLGTITSLKIRNFQCFLCVPCTWPCLIAFYSWVAREDIFAITTPGLAQDFKHREMVLGLL